MKITFKKIVFIFFLLLLMTELVLRWLGFGNAPVYIHDNNFEYIYAPSQDVKRLGKRILTNEFGMRSLPLTEKDSIRILIIGDSVINGGNWTDHDSLATTQLENFLSQHYHCNIRVLNISAGSWGPDNAVAFLNKYGLFGADLLFFVFSSHDYSDLMTHEAIVGYQRSYPSTKKMFALSEVYEKMFVDDKKYHATMKFDRKIIRYLKGLNPGWKQLLELAQKNNVPLAGYVHAERDELLQQQYNERGKKLCTLLSNYQVPFIKGIDKITVEDYRDNVHLNNKGQRDLAYALLPMLTKQLNQYVWKKK